MSIGKHAAKDSNLTNKSERLLLQRILVLAAIFIGLQLIFFLSNICAAALPKDAIQQNIEASNNSTLTQHFDYSHEILGSSVSFDNNRFIEAFANQETYDGDLIKESTLNMIVYTMPDASSSFEYFRYWHGWQLPVFLCLMIGNLDFLAVVLAILALGSAIFFFLQLRRFVGWIPSAVFSLVAFFSTNILGNFIGDLLLSLSISVLILCCAITLKLGIIYKNDLFKQDCICFIAACLFCFFDFFTIPSYAIALMVFSAMIASGCLNNNFKKAVILFVRFCALFLLGFILTWATKWIIASIYLTIPVVVANVFGEIGMWTIQSNGDSGVGLRDRFPRSYALAGSAWRVINNGNPDRAIGWNIAGIVAFIIFTIGLVMLIATLLKAKRNNNKLSSGIWGGLLPALLIPAAIIFMYHHVIFHVGIFGYKPWAFFLADISCIGFYLHFTVYPKITKHEKRENLEINNKESLTH